MNILKKTIITALIGILAFSCEEVLDTLPRDRVSSDIFWKTEQDAIDAATGMYSVLGDDWRYAGMDAYSDIGHWILQWRSESQVEKFTFDASSNVINNEYAYYYQLIQVASSFIENVDRVETLDLELNTQLKAEAKTLRAFAYINLVMLYGDVPLVTTLLTTEEARLVSRASTDEIWSFVSSELSAAAPALPLHGDVERGRITRGAAYGLLSRAMLYSENYSAAKIAAKNVMDLGVHAINDSYADLFDYAGESSSEIIFARQYEKNIDPQGLFDFFTPNSLYTQTCDIVPTKAIVDAYLMQSTGLPINDSGSGFDPFNPYADRDPRLHYSILVTGDILPNGEILNTLPGSGTTDDISITAENVTPTGFYMKKYLAYDDWLLRFNGGVNLIYLRYAEVLLNFAEASIELNQIDQSVLDAINELRGRTDVNMPLVTTIDQTELRKIVHRERMVELAFEGHRLFDIRRWGIGENVIPGTVKGMTYEDPKNPGSLITVELSGYVKEYNPLKHRLWPIPFNELLLNENLEQNQGY
jgi:hypothetical protein